MSDDEQDHDPYGSPMAERAVRAGRAGRVSLAVGAAVVLAGAGFGVGWASRGAPATAATGVVSGQVTPPSAVTAVGSGASVGETFVGQSFDLVPSSSSAAPTPLGRWTTADGIAVRAYETLLGTGAPAAACLPQGLALVELSDTDAVWQAGVPIEHLGAKQVAVAGSGVWGVEEGSPAGWTVVHTAPSITHVVLSVPGHSPQQLAVHDGIAVGAWLLPRGAAPVLGGSVSVSGAAPVPLTTYGYGASPLLPGCQPSTAVTVPTTLGLPPAGVQPSDPAAARAGVTKAYIDLFTPAGANVPMSQDAQGADAGMEAAKQTATENHPNDHVGYVIDQIVFTSPSAASVRYTIVDNGHTVLSQTGLAVLDGGTWKVARATACAVFALGGGNCQG